MTTTGIEGVKVEKLWTCIMTCSSCGNELNRAEHVPESKKTLVSLTSVFNGFCKNPQHNTFSDCNIHTNLAWTEEVPT